MNWVYIVLQFQPSSDYLDKPIYVLTSRAKAEEYAQTLNREYASKDVILDSKGNFLDLKGDYDYDSLHYYTVLPMRLNERLA